MNLVEELEERVKENKNNSELLMEAVLRKLLRYEMSLTVLYRKRLYSLDMPG